MQAEQRASIVSASGGPAALINTRSSRYGNGKQVECSTGWKTATEWRGGAVHHGVVRAPPTPAAALGRPFSSSGSRFRPLTAIPAVDTTAVDQINRNTSPVSMRCHNKKSSNVIRCGIRRNHLLTATFCDAPAPYRRYFRPLLGQVCGLTLPPPESHAADRAAGPFIYLAAGFICFGAVSCFAPAGGSYVVYLCVSPLFCLIELQLHQ